VTHLAALALLVGCPSSDDTTTTETDTTTPPPDTSDTAPVTTGATGATGDTAPPAPTGDTGPSTVDIDCSLVPASPVSTLPVVGARGYHDVIFDDTGRIFGSNGDSIIWADYYGNSGVLVPGTGLVQGLGKLLDGDFVGATDTSDSLFRFTSAGVTSPIIGNSGAYGVVVGPDGMIYTANYDKIERVDPVTGARTEIFSRPGFQPRVLNWNKDFTKLYMGTLGGNGDIYQIDVDPVTLDPLGPSSVFASGVGTGAYHDCLTVDYCDNVYVCDFSTSRLYRITPDGVASIYIQYPNGQYSHGAEWGSGIGGFRVDALYVSQPYNGDTVAEIVIGIPGKDWDGTGWTQ
jgi:hypothetical protein